MVDWAKRITKAAGDELRQGETVEVATLFQPSGMAGLLTGAAVGGMVGAAVASKLRKQDDGGLVTDEGIAASIPKVAVVVGLTSGGRVLVYVQGKMSGKPKEFAVALDRADIATIEVEPGKISKKVLVVFRDGTARVFESPALDKSIDAFVAALSPG